MQDLLNILLMAWLIGFAFHSRPIGILLVGAAWYFQFSGSSFNVGPYRLPGDLHWPLLIFATAAVGLYCLGRVFDLRNLFVRNSRTPYR